MLFEKVGDKMNRDGYNELRINHTSLQSAHQECIDRAYRIPVFLSTTTHLNGYQQKFLNR